MPPIGQILYNNVGYDGKPVTSAVMGFMAFYFILMFLMSIARKRFLSDTQRHRFCLNELKLHWIVYLLFENTVLYHS